MTTSETVLGSRELLEEGLEGPVVWRDDVRYGYTRDNLVWSERKPERYPEGILMAATIDDVASAVRWAKESGLQVSARSGGHSFAGSSVRDGALVIDVHLLDEIRVDKGGLSAEFGPGVRVQQLDNALAREDLFFPVGHAPDVGLAGFLLGGGYGWWVHHYGQSCLSITAIDVVTPDGEVIHADANENADYYWAARGSGPGFFGIVVRFYVRLYPRPKAIAETLLVFPMSRMDEILAWAHSIQSSLDSRVEFCVLGETQTGPDGSAERVLVVTGVAQGDSEAESVDLLRPITDCPFKGGSLMYQQPKQTTMAKLFSFNDLVNPPGYRYAVDTMWTSKSVGEVLPFLHAIAETFPSDESKFLWWHFIPQELPADAAVSSQANVAIATYGIYDDAARDAECQRWVAEVYKEFEYLSDGTACSDENFAARFHLPLSEQNLERLEALRDIHDPARVFPGFPRPGNTAV